MSPAEVERKAKKAHPAASPLRTTAARRASLHRTAQPAPRALRIGILLNGRIMEEKIIRERDSVTIGLYEKNTFIIPSPHMVGRHVLFEMKGDRYHLNLMESMTGRVAAGGGLIDLEGRGASAPIVLDERSRGRIAIGETIILFQFVAAPPLQPRPQLPSSMRGGWLRSFMADWFFNSLIGVSLMAHIIPVVCLVVRDWPIQEQGFDLDNKYFELVLQVPDEETLKNMVSSGKPGESAESPGEDEAAADLENPDVKPGDPGKPKRVLTDEEKAALEAQRRAKLEATVMSSGLMLVIGSDAYGADGSAGADLLAPGGVDSDMDEVLKTVSGMKLASAGETGSSLRTLADSAGGGKVADITAIKVANADVDLESDSATETKVKGKAKAGAGEEVGGTGLLDAAEVARVVKSRITAIQMCYQKGLNKNYGLEGKIKVRFTIGTSGRVTKASIENNTLGDPEVGACVLDKVESFVFSKPEGGSVEFVFPFVFKPAS